MPELRVEGAEKFGVLADALRSLGEKELEKELYSGLNRSVKPLTAAVKDGTPRYLPRRYAFELSKSLKVKARRRSGRNPGITLQGSAKTPKGKDRDLRSLNRGRLRHPLYGNRGFWYNQPVPPNWWDDPLLSGADEVRKEIVGVMDDLASRLARKL